MNCRAAGPGGPLSDLRRAHTASRPLANMNSCQTAADETLRRAARAQLLLQEPGKLPRQFPRQACRSAVVRVVEGVVHAALRPLAGHRHRDRAWRQHPRVHALRGKQQRRVIKDARALAVASFSATAAALGRTIMRLHMHRATGMQGKAS